MPEIYPTLFVLDTPPSARSTNNIIISLVPVFHGASPDRFLIIVVVVVVVRTELRILPRSGTEMIITPDAIMTL